MSRAFARWFTVHGGGLDEASARAAWNAALDEAYDLALERGRKWREKGHANDFDADFAQVKALEARAVAADVFALRGAA